jgi:hypothetical protein
MKMEDRPRADWTSQYYHRADTQAIGFDRTETGSNAVGQYHEPLRSLWNDIETTPEKFLLWFHRVEWDHEMESGRTLWDEMALLYQSGVDSVRWMQEQWANLEGYVDDRRYQDVKTYLEIQEREARWWKDACLLYFQTYSRMPFPEGVEEPVGERTIGAHEQDASGLCRQDQRRGNSSLRKALPSSFCDDRQSRSQAAAEDAFSARENNGHGNAQSDHQKRTAGTRRAGGLD